MFSVIAQELGGSKREREGELHLFSSFLLLFLSISNIITLLCFLSSFQVIFFFLSSVFSFVLTFFIFPLSFALFFLRLSFSLTLSAVSPYLQTVYPSLCSGGLVFPHSGGRFPFPPPGFLSRGLLRLIVAAALACFIKGERSVEARIHTRENGKRGTVKEGWEVAAGVLYIEDEEGHWR